MFAEPHSNYTQGLQHKYLCLAVKLEMIYLVDHNISSTESSMKEMGQTKRDR